jgi:hypothetical protein
VTTKIDIVPTPPGTTPSPSRGSEYPDVWAEIPPNGKVCPHTGLKHAKLYSILGTGGIARRFVRVANLRDPDATQGKTLFHLGDMLRFLDAVAAKQGSGQDRDRLAEIA